MSRKAFLTTLLIFTSSAFGLASGSKHPPKLLVVISIDQFSPDYFSRYDLKYGLKRLKSGGITYSNCNLGYAITETGPGHATLATGCYPSKHGIQANEWF